MFSKTFSKMGLDIDSHDFRHTKITELVEAGMPLTEVQSYVGHTDAKTTLGYVRRKKPAEILNNLIDINL